MNWHTAYLLKREIPLLCTLTLIALVLYRCRAPRWLTETKRARLARLFTACSTAGMLVVLASLLPLSPARFYTNSMVYDAPYCYQGSKVMATGSGYFSSALASKGFVRSTVDLSLVADYGSLLREHQPWLLAPVYRIVYAVCGSHQVVFILVLVAAVFAAVPAYVLLVSTRFPAQARLLTAAFVLSPLLLYQALGDYSWYPFGLATGLLFVHWFLQERYGLAALASLAAVLAFEQYILVFGLFFARLFFHRQARAWSAGMLTIYAAYYLFLKFGLPRWWGVTWALSGGFSLMHFTTASVWIRFAQVWLYYGLCFLFLPFRNRFALASVTGILLLYFASGRELRYAEFHYCYPAMVLPFLAYGLCREFPRLRHPLRFALTLVAVNLCLLYAKGPLPLARSYLLLTSPGNMRQYLPSNHDRLQNAAAQYASSLASADSLVIAPLPMLFPLAGSFNQVYTLYTMNDNDFHSATLIIYDEHDIGLTHCPPGVAEITRARIEHLLHDPRYQLCWYDDGIYLFARQPVSHPQPAVFAPPPAPVDETALVRRLLSERAYH